MREFHKTIVKQLEFLMTQKDLDTELFIFKKGNQFMGFEFAENKTKPITIAENEVLEKESIIALYLKVKKELGFKENQSKLKALRLSNHLTVQETADLLDKTRQEISRWENTYNPPNEIISILIEKLKKRLN
jgi:DNA-binding transcriptional regulator YiaG